MKIRNKLKKILALTLALSMSVGMLHIPTETNLVNAATVEDKEFACTISPASNTDTDPQITYGCDSVTKLSATEAASAGLPSGYTDNVIKVSGKKDANGIGAKVDFSGENINQNDIESITFRVLVKGISASGNYPEFRISNHSKELVTQVSVASNIGEWVNVTVDNAGNNFNKNCSLDNLCKDGKLNKINLFIRYNSNLDEFYIDSIKVKLKEKAAPTEVTIEGLSLDYDYLWPKKNGYWNIWQIYLNTDVNLPADKTFNVTLRDDNTEFNGTKLQKSSVDKRTYLEINTSFLPENATKTFTIKAGTYEATDGSCSIVIKKDYSIHVEGGVWSQAGTKPTLEGVESFTSISFGCAWDHNTVIGNNKDGFYVYSTIDDGSVLNNNWNENYYLTPINVDDEKTTFYGSATWFSHTEGEEKDRRSEYKTGVRVTKFSKDENGCSYFVNLGQVPVAGDIVRFGGYYKDPTTGKIYYFTPIKVQFVTGTDGNLTCKQIENDLTAEYAGTLTIKGGANDVYGAVYKTSELYFSGTDNYAYGLGEEKWNAMQLDVANSEGSITLDGNKITNVELQKYSYRYNTASDRWDNLYYLNGLSGVETNSVLTIDGKFKDGNKTVTFNKSQFKWDGIKWIDVATTNGTLTTTIANGAETDSKDSKGNVYLKGTDTYLNNRTYNEWVSNDARLVAANDDSGVFVGDTRVSATLIKYSGKNNWYYLECNSADTSKVLTVKGTFMTDKGIPAVNIEDSSFHWDGTKWVDGGLITDITINGFDSSISKNKWYYPTDTQSGWRVYFDTSELPGTGNENYKLTFSNGIMESEVTLYRFETNNKIYGYIPKELVDSNKKHTLTLKSNKYYAYKDEKKLDYGINIKNDVIIYISEYGWSFNSSEIKPDKKISRSFVLNETSSNANMDSGKNGFYVTLSEDDGVSVAAKDWNGWADNNRIMAMNSNSTTYYSAGIYMNGESLQQSNTGFNKLNNDSYYISVYNAGGDPTEVGDTYVIKGLFKNPADGSTIEYRPLTVKWTENGWEQVYTALDDTGVKYDINGDKEVDIRDLVALKIYMEDNMHSINVAQADVNKSGAIDNQDVITFRKILAGAISYNDDGSISGIPTYNTERTFNKAAYASVKIGEWADEYKTSMTYYEDSVINESMKKFKDAGLNLLISENVTYHHENTAYNDNVKKYLECAERNDLGVLIMSSVIWDMVNDNPEKYNNETRTWQQAIDNVVTELRQYSSKAFKGFAIYDEVKVDQMANYNKVTSYIHSKYPELIIHSSLLPTRAYDEADCGPTKMTTDTSIQNSMEKTYKDYTKNLALDAGVFTFDLYPLMKKTSNITIFNKEEYYIKSDYWFNNHKWVAEVCKEQNYKFYKGVTIQSCELVGTEASGWFSSGESAHAPELKEDIGFQVFTSMAYGVKEINYFTYNDHHSDEKVVDYMTNNEKIYNSVQTINGQVDNFANVYLAYDWRDTFDIADKATYSTTETATDNGRLQSASVSGARTLIGHMKDVDGFDGYMISNATAPRTSSGVAATNATTVKLNFKDATKAVVYDYQAGTRKVVDLTDGTLTVTVNVGEGTFVIPVK